MKNSDKERLWSLCFGDAEDVARSFFEIPEVLTLTEYENDSLIGMASMIPVTCDGGACGYYVYGVCVHPDHRGRGVFKKLMDKCEIEAKRSGADMLCLIPATDRLAKTYANMGYYQKVALSDDPQKSGVGILAISSGFRSFAIPDDPTQPRYTSDFGVLKPISSKISPNESFCFEEHMGER